MACPIPELPPVTMAHLPTSPFRMCSSAANTVAPGTSFTAIPAACTAKWVNGANVGDILGSGCGVSRSASASRHRALTAPPAIDVSPLPGRLGRLSARPDTAVQQVPRRYAGGGSR